MTRGILKQQFILLFIYLNFIIHTLADPSEAVKNEFMAWRKRSHEARLSGRTNQSLQSSNVTGFHSDVPGFQKPQDSVDVVGLIDNDHWAGAIQANPPNGTYQIVSASWSVPSIALPQGANGSGVWSAAVWVGMDGAPPSPCIDTVLQAGTYSYLQVFENGTRTSLEQAWYEWFPADPVFLDLDQYPVAAGDPIAVAIGAYSPTAGVAHFTNTNTGKVNYSNVNAPNSSYDVCGATVEWILELVSPQQLGDFGTTYMQNCTATTTTDDVVHLDNATLVHMKNNLNEVLAWPSINSSDVLEVLYGAP